MDELINQLNIMQSQHIKELEERVQKLLNQLNKIQKDNIKAKEYIKELKEQIQIQLNNTIKAL